MKTITFKIDPKGGVAIIPSGFGSDCVEATKDVEDRLGIAKAGRELTAEYFAQVEQKQTLGL